MLSASHMVVTAPPFDVLFPIKGITFELHLPLYVVLWESPVRLQNE